MMSESRVFVPFFEQLGRAPIGWPGPLVPRQADFGAAGPGPALTPLEIELASAVFSPIFYTGVLGWSAGKPVSEGFRHFITVGIDEALAPSPLFDPLIYKARALLAGHSLREAETPSFFHWLRYGMARRIVPSAFFDEAYYQAANPDVAQSGAFGFVHFLLWGMPERRAPNAAFNVGAIMAAAAASGGPAWSLIDAYVQWHAREPERPPPLNAEEDQAAGHTLAWRWRAGAAHEDNPEDPLGRYFEAIGFEHAAAFGWAKLVTSCWPLSEDTDATHAVAARVRANPMFDAAFYRAQAGLDCSGLDPALHYVLVGEALGLLPSPAFDPGYYARRNPDVMRTGMNLLLHYAEYGRAEGRHGRAPAVFHSNPERFDPARDNVIVVVHEASRTGAPILGWNIVSRLAQRYNVFTVRLGEGALTPAFEALSAETHGPFLRSQRHKVDIEHGLRPLFAHRIFRYAIVNSAESRALVEACALHFVPTLFLMHEFASYVPPVSSLRRAFDWASEIVFSAPMVARTAEIVHPALRARTTRMLPQGMCVVPAGHAPSKPPPTAKLETLAAARAAGTFLVIGAGTVELRKGVDLFLTAAVATRRSNPGRPVHFVWVGHGYSPDTDMGYSVYLQEQLRRSGLEDGVTFLGEMADLEPVYALADVLLLTSRLDPLPNVAIDAAYRCIPIVCFQDASGIADLMLDDPGTAPGVVPHLDAEAAGRVIAHLASDAAARQDMAAATLRRARALFDMDRYLEQLDALGAALAPGAAQLRADAETLLLDDSFDQDLYLGAAAILESREQTIARYLASHALDKAGDRAGKRRPAPGFDPRAWAGAHPDGVAAGIDPLADFIRAGRPAGPWQAAVLRPPADQAALSAGGLRAVLHAHLPDPALAASLLAHLRPNALACDLLATTGTAANADALRQALSPYGQGTVSVHVLHGDLASLTAPSLAAAWASYDMVGHVHAEPGHEHALWREFQWQALLGGRHAMRDRILDAFAHAPELGLVLAADPFLPGGGADVPSGGMAWVRRAVLQAADGLAGADLAGSRLLSMAAGKAGLAHAVAHVPGVFW